ncbi:MAG: exonuclease SbcCD subunit D [Dehalococcoidales bacterium]|nr:exonuclease SbcCD subunit D [Dehalococcoidales bacterium]
MKILHFADLHLGVESYGHINPATGLSTRLDDILSALDKVVDYALNNDIDLILFCGDAYRNREPSQTQQREFARRINRLSGNGIPTFLLIGNHDLPNAIGKATSTEIFDTLDVKDVYVSSRPEVYSISTKHGIVQIASLPWLRRSGLLSKEETKNLNFEQINQRMQDTLTNILASHTARLDTGLPAILAAHVWVVGATIGTEKMMTIGQEHTLLLSNVANPAFDYVALGHIHKRQVLTQNPPVVYAGSLEGLDFSDEDDEKGFYVIDIESEGKTGKRRVTFDFHPTNGRQFLTISATITTQDADPMTSILAAISEKKDRIEGAIVRLQLTVPAEIEGMVRDNEIRNALKDAYYFTVAKEVKRETRPRLGNWIAAEVTPLDALKAYLEQKKTSPERAKELTDYGRGIIEESQD